MMSTQRPLNKRVIVIYQNGGSSLMFHRYVDTIDVREACTKEICEYTDEHYIFDGQIFYQDLKDNRRKR